jgi:hypothetical protein
MRLNCTLFPFSRSVLALIVILLTASWWVSAQAPAPAAPQPSAAIQELQQKYDAAQKALAEAQKQLDVDSKALDVVGSATKTKAAKETASQGVPLKSSTTVKDNVLVHAVLLPRGPAASVFGRDIADNYAVVQLTISNLSKTSSLVVDSVFLDYSKWALSGVFRGDNPDCSGYVKLLPDAQQADCPGQIASVESRVIRDELQNKSTWTARNGWVRGFVLAGTIASGFSFLGSANVASGIAAYTGNVIPGIQAFWPDQTIPQINHVSDLGFKTGKLFPKESADIVFAFFPIDIFLTTGFGDIFRKDPALFFAPGQLFADTQITGGKRANGKWYCPGVDKKSCISAEVVKDLKGRIKNLAGIGTSFGVMTPGAVIQLPASTPDDPERDSDNEMLRRALSSCKRKVLGGGKSEDSAQKAKTAKPADVWSEFDDGCRSFVKADEAWTATSLESALEAAALEVAGTKAVLQRISLNSVEVVVSGSMTVNVDAVPATLTRLTFDNSDAAVFSKACVAQAGTIEGQFLTGGKPSISKIDLPTDLTKDSPFYGKSAADFVDTVAVDSEKSNDLGLAFSLELKNPIPPGSEIHFVVTKPDPGDTTKSKTLKSAELLYPGDSKTLDYSPAPTLKALSTESCSDLAKASTKPAITKIQIKDGENTNVLSTTGKPLSGTVTGTDLDGATLKVESIKTPTSTKIEDFVASTATDPGQTSATTLIFKITLKKAVPAGSTINFVARTEDKDKVTVSSDVYDLTVKAAAAKPAAGEEKKKTAAAGAAPAKKGNAGTATTQPTAK